MAALTQIHTWREFGLNELADVAHDLVDLLPYHAVVAMHGPMGAGKTTLIRALLQCWNVKEEGASPTFGLVHHHTGERGGVRFEIRHMDLYRMKNEEEAERAGIADMLAEQAMHLVEWPERIPGLMPSDAWLIELSHATNGKRTCILSAFRD